MYNHLPHVEIDLEVQSSHFSDVVVVREVVMTPKPLQNTQVSANPVASLTVAASWKDKNQTKITYERCGLIL